MLKVDNREGKCKEIFEECKVECTLENLVYGDFQILNKEGGIHFIFERKTIEDLLASIKDGRYKNQKAKLFESFKPSQIYYIIEGGVSFMSTAVATKKVLQGAVINTLLRDKIGIFFTKDVKETCELLLGIYKRYCDEPEKYCIDAQGVERVEVVQTNKTDDPTKVFKSMLCQIPHVNDKTATELVGHFGSLSKMVSMLNQLPEEERAVHMLTIKVNGRKMSSRVAESIVRNLC